MISFYHTTFVNSNSFKIEEKEDKPSYRTAIGVLRAIESFVSHIHNHKFNEGNFQITFLNEGQKSYDRLGKAAPDIEKVVNRIFNGYESAYAERRWKICKIWDRIKDFLGYETEKSEMSRLKSEILKNLGYAKENMIPYSIESIKHNKQALLKAFPNLMTTN